MAEAFGKARYPLIVILVVATISLFIWTASTQRTRARASVALIEPSATELAVALMRAGVGPEALAAAGLSANGATNVVGDLRDLMIANPGTLSAADAAYASAKQSVDHLKRLIQSGLGAAENVTVGEQTDDGATHGTCGRSLTGSPFRSGRTADERDAGNEYQTSCYASHGDLLSTRRRSADPPRTNAALLRGRLESRRNPPSDRRGP